MKNNSELKKELLDILQCISVYDKTASLEEKGKYFEVIQKDVQNLVKLFSISDTFCRKPSNIEKNNLPINIRYLFNRTIEQYQNIQHYENGIINKNEFCNEIESIEKTYLKKCVIQHKK